MVENKNNRINETQLSNELLKNRWGGLCQRLNISNSQQFFNDINDHYSESHRHYHTLGHVNNCFKEFDLVKPLLDNPEAVELAIWFHDIIYDIGGKDNEERSAEMAVKFCQKNKLSENFTKEVKNHILATGNHTLSDNLDTNYLIDIDMSILGQPIEKMYEYEEQIYQEYSNIYTKKEYVIGRFGFLTSLKDHNVYKTDYFRDKYEQPCHDNVPMIIENLQKIVSFEY
jgi:predicted metal-dependent HD superfamily phosphohydrolase